MDAKQTFDQITANYNEAKADSTNFTKLCNALESMNKMPEQLALQQVHYSPLTRSMLDQKSEAVRKQHPALEDVKLCADTLKHTRHHKGQKVDASSTGILPEDPTTWAITCDSKRYDLFDVAERAYATLSSIMKSS